MQNQIVQVVLGIVQVALVAVFTSIGGLLTHGGAELAQFIVGGDWHEAEAALASWALGAAAAAWAAIKADLHRITG